MNAYTNKKVNDILSSHAQAVQSMQGSARQLGDLGIRTIQLWTMAMALLTEEERTAAGLAFAADGLIAWNSVKTGIVTGLDALAAGVGMTRSELLSVLANEPDTNFNI